MIQLKNINIKYLITIGFGIVGLLLSLFTGIFSGNGISTILFRAFITAIILSIVGFICLFIIEQFVPEIYQVIGSMNIENANVNLENSDNTLTEKTESNDTNENRNTQNIELADNSISDEISTVKSEDIQLERQFNTIEKQTDHYSSLNVDEKDSSTISRDILKDNKIKYEPKIAAQAIRTMMKRDE